MTRGGGGVGQKMTKDDTWGGGRAKDDEWLKYVYFALIDMLPNDDWGGGGWPKDDER